jgi:hypothetical protein
MRYIEKILNKLWIFNKKHNKLIQKLILNSILNHIKISKTIKLI